jgi:hypothetical protein
MIGTVRISQLPPAETITGNETLIVNQDGDTRRTTASDVVGIVNYVQFAGIATYASIAGVSTFSEYASIAGVATVSQGLIGNPVIAVSSLNVSGVSTLGNVQVSSGIITATSGIVTYYGDGSKLQNIISGVGIQSTGTVIGTGITTLNFIGAGNTFSVDGGTVNISIQGGGGGSQWVDGTLGISTSSFVGIGTTNPISPLQVGAAGTNVFVVTGIGSVGVGTTNPNTKLHVVGDINLDDGGTFTTTLQLVTPTANRTISFPDQMGTVALVGGSSGQFIYNNNGSYSGVNTLIFDGTNVTLSGRLINTYTSVASSPAKVFTGTWFINGTSTTTKPHFLVEPSGATSTNWSTVGTGIGINAASSFTGRLIDLQLNGTPRWHVNGSGLVVGTQASPVGVSSTTTVTIANIQVGIITTNTPTNIDITVPTGTNMDGGFVGVFNDMSVMWSIINIGSNTATLVANTGHTIVGAAGISSNTSGRFISRRTAATTWVSYRAS